MSEESEYGPYKTLLEKEIGAAISLESYYCGPHSHVTVEKNVQLAVVSNNKEAEQRLLFLAKLIDSGQVTSHSQIAIVLRSLGGRFGPSGGLTSGINSAALKVEEALLNSPLSSLPPESKKVR